jgi:hypothetical protein
VAMDDYEIIGPDKLSQGDIVEVPEEEPGVIWVVGEQAGHMLSQKRERFVFDVRDYNSGEDAELTIDVGKFVRRYLNPPPR